MYSQEEKEIARSIVDNKHIMELLKKVLVDPREDFGSEMILSKTNEQLGEIVRADDLATQKIIARFNTLKTMASMHTGNTTPIAPK